MRVCWVATPPRYGILRWLRSRRGWRRFKKQPYWKSARVIARERGLR